jgi:hypothetical protein
VNLTQKRIERPRTRSTGDDRPETKHPRRRMLATLNREIQNGARARATAARRTTPTGRDGGSAMSGANGRPAVEPLELRPGAVALRLVREPPAAELRLEQQARAAHPIVRDGRIPFDALVPVHVQHPKHRHGDLLSPVRRRGPSPRLPVSGYGRRRGPAPPPARTTPRQPIGVRAAR